MNNTATLSAQTHETRFTYQRSPKLLMKLNRLGSFHASRLSFMRILLRTLYQAHWQFSQHAFEINRAGEGYAVYTAKSANRVYSLVAFSHAIDDDMRSDRVIADRWDCTFTLFDGLPTDADIRRLQANVPLQEAGRISEKELSLARANRSERLWDYIIDCLANGQQPDEQTLVKSGYLMRTTAVYGSGKFGAADREVIASRDEFNAPFQVEMLHVYLIRWFVRDLANFFAELKGGERAVKLDNALAKQLGIGNSTGLGMAPFLVNHPELLNNWISAREIALATVRQLPHAKPAEMRCFLQCFQAMQNSVNHWQSNHPIQQEKNNQLQSDMALIATYLETFDWQGKQPWHGLFLWAEKRLGAEAQELLVSLVLEPYPHLVDELSHCMAAPPASPASPEIDGQMTIAECRTIMADYYDWALKIDWNEPKHKARVWYISEEKLEPRLGERYEEPIAEYEQPLCPAQKIAQLDKLAAGYEDKTVADFLFYYPAYRETIKRIIRLITHPYAEILDNTLADTMLPIDMLRCKLSFFGATNFDPRSDRWVRIVMFQNAPYPDELSSENYDYWPYQTMRQ